MPLLPVRRLRTLPPRPLPERLSAVGERGIEASPSSAGLHAEDINSIWRGMKGLYATGMSPGIALHIRRRGQSVFNRSLGYANVEQETPLTLDTPVCLFSASKAVTAMLVHHLVEQGELVLDKPVAHYLPEYGCNGKERTTLMHLLTHRGGIPRIREPVTAEDLFRPEKLRDLMIRAQPERPGRRQSYHALTAGFVLGAVMEKVTGAPLNDLLDRVIREPLGMTHFSYGLSGVEPAMNYVTGRNLAAVDLFLTYAIGGSLDDAVKASNDRRFRDVTIPAGNIYATAEESSRFFQMLLDGGRWGDRQVFHPDTVRRATTGVKSSRIDRTLMLPLQYSPGFMLGAQNISLYGRGTPQAFGHLGFISIYCWADPQRDIAAALLTTGKGIVGPHLPQLLRLQQLINKHTDK